MIILTTFILIIISILIVFIEKEPKTLVTMKLIKQRKPGSYYLNFDDGNILDPKKSLSQLKIYKVAWLVITLSSIGIATDIAMYDQLPNNYSRSLWWSNFISHFKVPLSLITLLVPVIALIASLHKSKQTQLQIEISEHINKMNLHFKYKEEFKNFIARSKKLIFIQDKHSEYIYEIMFPHSKNGVFDGVNPLEIDFIPFPDKKEAIAKVLKRFKLLESRLPSDLVNKVYTYENPNNEQIDLELEKIYRNIGVLYNDLNSLKTFKLHV
ncbi:hypothetical protein [Paraferrimonas sp. SM1919]|uniref:hypothetical protein n=1 Tax=Paraferrimonas sp. SM1919 TaxID=2662263 RepID=UPI0013D42A30|nr:hypothetical protein [Paraferrimonas sp. SM1919]